MRKFIIIAITMAGACSMPESNENTQDVATTFLVPTSDVANSSVVGVGDTVNLYRNVDDGTTTTAADDSTTYVRGKAAVASSSHEVGYSGAPSGTVTAVDVHYRAQRGSAQGTVQVLLYDGSTLIGTGAVHTAGSWANYTDSYTGLNVSNGNNLRTKIVFNNTAATGALRYTQIWLGLTYGTTMIDAGVDAPPADSSSSGTFPPGTICNNTGTARTRPTSFRHVIVFMFENKNYSSVMFNANAPYMSSIAQQCAYSTAFVDNVFSSDINSLSHYMAVTSGSNCNTGIGTNGTGCITDDNGPSSHMLSTVSIMEQSGSYKAYIESMPSACSGSSSGGYAPKHNPPVYYTRLATSCPADDLGIAAVTCPTTVGATCSQPGTNAFTTDLANDTLPTYAWVTPNLTNDMHDGTVSQGDNWLHTYLPLVLNSAAYLRGEVAVYILWDEQGSFSSGPTPNAFVSPYISPRVSSTQMNLFAALRGMESQLGYSYLGCAGGTPPGGVGTCPSGSTADVRSIFNF